MTYKYTNEDVQDARSNTLRLAGTDVEISVGYQGHDLMLWVNKASIQILRIRLANAVKDIPELALMEFSSFAPDFVFKIGDCADGLVRLKRSLGMPE